jgi:hypothetical protein
MSSFVDKLRSEADLARAKALRLTSLDRQIVEAQAKPCPNDSSSTESLLLDGKEVGFRPATCRQCSLTLLRVGIAVFQGLTSWCDA